MILLRLGGRTGQDHNSAQAFICSHYIYKVTYELGVLHGVGNLGKSYGNVDSQYRKRHKAYYEVIASTES
jgi:hypothetical protein